MERVEGIAYTYEYVRRAALAVQKDPKWLDDEKVQKMTFSDAWINDFLEDEKLRRRQVTTRKDPSTLPPLDAILSWQQSFRKWTEENNLSPALIMNFDESSEFYEAAYKHKYTDECEKRATDTADEMKRIQMCMGATGVGQTLPAFHMVRGSTSAADQSNTRILDNLVNELNERVSMDPPRFELGVIEHTLELPNKSTGKMASVKFVRKYIRDRGPSSPDIILTSS